MRGTRCVISDSYTVHSNGGLISDIFAAWRRRSWWKKPTFFCLFQERFSTWARNSFGACSQSFPQAREDNLILALRNKRLLGLQLQLCSFLHNGNWRISVTFAKDTPSAPISFDPDGITVLSPTGYGILIVSLFKALDKGSRFSPFGRDPQFWRQVVLHNPS